MILFAFKLLSLIQVGLLYQVSIPKLVPDNLLNLWEHGYDDLQEDWVEETIHLDYLDGIVVEGFRFIQTSDNFVEGDGFSIDNFQILAIPPG